MITLSNGTDTVELDADLRWTDEFDWSPVIESRDRSLTGALLVDSSELIAGRPITLAPFDADSGWMTRGQALALRQWAAEAPDAAMTLTWNGAAYAVRFRHPSAEGEQPAVGAEPVVFYADPQDEDPVLVTLRLITV
ncbi:hypothetical protein [Pseudacidovorax sp. NFM-22]|uniref:hypothetical protein n=1 Tax=Pseudacidovorax sp. NFM-22 TaxID=2744469 RepID=UPI001F3A5B89|nr:hypothetical protein [Pseudacidovorax sp. NFM-22]